MTEGSTATSLQTTTITATEGFTSTVVSIATEKATVSVTSAQTERITTIETLVNLQTMTATATVTEKVASTVPTTLVSTMFFTEKMLPVTVYVTSTETRQGLMTTLIQNFPVIQTQTESLISTATAKITETVSASCAPTTITSSVQVPTTVISTILETRPMTMSQKNVITVTGDMMTTTATVYSTTTRMTTVTAVSKLPPMACPLQEKTITRLITSFTTPTSTNTSVYTAMTSKVPVPSNTSKTANTVVMISSSSGISGSICPTPTVSSAPNATSVIGGSGDCQEGKKRCDAYDRRQYNECKGGQWSAGIKLTEADNMQCEESSGTVKLVPIAVAKFQGY